MDYGRDKRTLKKMLSDFEYGKSAEEIIALRLNTYFGTEVINNKDKAGEFSKYSPDLIIWYGDREWKIEIKYTKQPLKYVQFKENQYNYSIENNVYLLQVAGGKIAWINPKDKCFYKELGYCNKPTYSFYPKQWFNNFEELFNYLTY